MLTSPPTVVAAVTAAREAGLISPRLCSINTSDDRDRREEANLEVGKADLDAEDRRTENMMEGIVVVVGWCQGTARGRRVRGVSS